MKSLQEEYAPRSICFGCGPANAQGLRIRSFPGEDGKLVADWIPGEHHQAFPGVLNGGIIGALLDCHSNWTAAYTLLQRAGGGEIPRTVTADFAVQLKRPTPMGVVHLEAHAVEVKGDRATIEATLTAGGKICATCRGTFIAVKEGHPAFARWAG